MKKIFVSLFFLWTFSLIGIGQIYAQATPVSESLPPICGCPVELNKLYEDAGGKEKCITDYATFKSNPTTNHLWIEDEAITSQGKSNDRARQFIYWVMTHNAIDNHPVLTSIWGTARNLAYLFTILFAALLGLAIIIGQRTSYDTGVKLWPAVTKILSSLLYISFSATIIILTVQLSEVLMKFFIENLGGKDLFNIYFSGISQEKNYVDFVGCRDINIRVQEAVKAEITLLKLTNFSYYLMGTMLLLRKIILWFLLFLSPFLTVTLFFSFIKNVGMIWIGVFFQWVFYGPLLALFLGGLATIWKIGIPYVFDFSRAGSIQGYIYPTAINILYGGPAQKLAATNNGNYIDTFVEYIITLIMLLAVTIFPWFLLRTFQDYCCQGINAIKNLLLGNLNKISGGPLPSPVSPSLNMSLGAAANISQSSNTQVRTRIETIEEIKKSKTEEIVNSLDIKASKITDVAHFETNKSTTDNMNYLKNPTQAKTSSERLKYMNIRSELSSRAMKADPIANRFINSFIVPRINIAEKENIIKTLPKTTEVLTPESKKNIEEIIAVSPTVTLDEYEQVKKMWINAYEKGEIPKTENIRTRGEWVEYDIVLITNTLNKLLSDDKMLKAQALDEIGYILPIFLINNLSGDQLVTYLKAKIEAAKQVNNNILKEKEITQKLKAKSEEELVDVLKPKKKEAGKTMEMKEELKIEN